MDSGQIRAVSQRLEASVKCRTTDRSVVGVVDGCGLMVYVQRSTLWCTVSESGGTESSD